MRIVVVMVMLLAACSSTTKWRYTQPSDMDEMDDGTELVLTTTDRAIHLDDAQLEHGRLVGGVIHVWKIPAGTTLSADDPGVGAEQLARQEGWVALEGDPGPIELSAIRSVRIATTRNGPLRLLIGVAALGGLFLLLGGLAAEGRH
jgi:hypothetical protein